MPSVEATLEWPYVFPGEDVRVGEPNPAQCPERRDTSWDPCTCPNGREDPIARTPPKRYGDINRALREVPMGESDVIVEVVE